MDQESLLEARRLSLRSFELWSADGQPEGKFPDYWDKAIAEIKDDEADWDAAIDDSFPASDPPSNHGVVTSD